MNELTEFEVLAPHQSEILNRRRTFRVSSQGKTAHGSHLRTIADADVEATGFEEITREIIESM